jgi:amino acid transporter
MSLSHPRKFGAFAGVFTPSILTILGVIIYMRLGWVVGQAGLITAFGIIILAHVISVSTGLSISSIATDKKIKTGGIYYILSRSLGLPMGGAIGITIFAGTAFSIALYIIGFCENFLGIETISQITGLEPGILGYRLVGTIILILLVIIAFISTSIAIKAQFIILAAIGLSLISIFAGFITNDIYEPANISWFPVHDGISMITIFAIFFPAVTGFTVGVAMSGDLKNPRKNIPIGTLAAILVGLIIYLSLALLLALYVDRDLLLTDKNFLMHIAWSAPLVVAGIWGATLSSALGGILGGPRILQAISKDKITPGIFGKGYGINNEPRNALILTFIIAELGILIGELDVIAAIVTMFFIAAYGFINLAFALESWASTDFRPSFRISKWFGIVGFIACFAVMFKINTLAMIIALIILAGIYFYIKRKKLALIYGDVWQSVWSSTVRSILKQIDKKGLEERNWRPNIILFSGGTKTRPHLIQLGNDLVGKLGLLSNFDLILNKSAKVLFKKHQQALDTKDSSEYEGVFTRRHECKDIYEGIEAIASTYGFSGVEPNTILLGWARQSQDPVRFVNMIKTLSDLDLNILMVDYNKETGFGKRQKIDIWCRGGGNNCTLMLTLTKFLWLSDNWKNAQARILIINPINDEKERLIKDAEKVLEKYRMDAEIKVLNNQIEQRPVNEIIQVESSNSDLVFFGIPEVFDGQEQQYVENVNELCQNIGTVVLVKASSYFKEIEIGITKGSYTYDKSEFIRKGTDFVSTREINIPEIKFPANPILAEYIQIFYDKVKTLDETIYKKYLADLYSYHYQPVEAITLLSTSHLNKLNHIVTVSDSFNKIREISSLTQAEIIQESKKVILGLDESNFSEQFEILSDTLLYFSEQVEKLSEGIPEEINIEYNYTSLKIKPEDTNRDIIFKTWNRFRLKSFNSNKKYTIQYKNLFLANLNGIIQQAIYELLQNWGMISLQYITKIQKLNESIMDSYVKIEKNILETGLISETIKHEIYKLEKQYEKFQSLNEVSLQSLYHLLLNKTFYIVQQLSNDLKHVNPNKFIKERRSNNAQILRLKNKISKVPEYWQHNMQLLNGLNILQLEFYQFILFLYNDFHELHQHIKEKIEHLVIKHYKTILTSLKQDEVKYIDTIKNTCGYLDPEQFKYLWNEMTESIFEKISTRSGELPKSIEIIRHNIYENFKTEQFTNYKPDTVYLKNMADFIIQHEFISPVETNLTELKDIILHSIKMIVHMVIELDKKIQLIEQNPTVRLEIQQTANDLTTQTTREIIKIEKLVLKNQNQIKERRNALFDKFSLLTIIRKTNSVKKFVR